MTPVSGRRGLSALRVKVVYLLHMPPYGRPLHANPLTSLLRIRGRRSALVAPQRRTDRDCRPGAQHWNLLAPPTSAADLASNAPQRRLQRSWRWALPNDLRRRTGVGTLPDDLYHGTWHRAERSERRWESLRDALPGLRPALPGLPGLLVTGDVARCAQHARAQVASGWAFGKRRPSLVARVRTVGVPFRVGVYLGSHPIARSRVTAPQSREPESKTADRRLTAMHEAFRKLCRSG